MEWVILFSQIPLSAGDNMRLDAERLASLQRGDAPILCFHNWRSPTATYGYFVEPGSYFHFPGVKMRGLDLARRSTGGGIVFHTWDLSFSVIIPADYPAFSQNTLENYAYVNRAIVQAVTEFSGEGISPGLTLEDGATLGQSTERFCMARPTKYDVVWQGKKIAGASQRKTKKGFLHQGTISLTYPDEEELRSVLLPGTSVIEAMRASTWALLPEKVEKKQLEEARVELRKLVQKWIVEQ